MWLFEVLKEVFNGVLSTFLNIFRGAVNLCWSQWCLSETQKS